MNPPDASPPVPSATLAAGAAQDATHGELQRRIAELAAGVAARDAFMAVAAHELRNPMTPILGQVDLLLAAVKAGNCPPEQLEQRLGRIQHSVVRYVKRATVMLGVSRLTRGGFRPDLEAFDLSALLREAVAEFGPAARHAGVAITLKAPETLPVRLDRMATEQIIDNLVSNALKYGDRTPVDVTAEVAGQQVRIEVRDHGPGIPPGDRAQMLSTFEHVVGHGERRSGFGIGLWVVGQFVAAMEGTVTIGDAPGGALFTVILPRQLKKARHLQEERA